MAGWMLDTSICVAVLRDRVPATRSRIIASRFGEIVISAVVAGKLWTGVRKARRLTEEKALRDLFDVLPVLDWPAAAAQTYGELRSEMESSGQMIGALDMLIAAHALHEKATLVTDNVREFQRVRGLRVENWMR